MKKIILSLLYVCFVCAHAQATSPDYQNIIDSAYKQFTNESGGKVADYIPALAKYSNKYYGIVLVTADGKIYTKGDVKIKFPLESVSKIFTLSLALKEFGAESILQHIGANATGFPFNSVTAIEERSDKLGNSLVNAGAMATVSILQGDDAVTKWNDIVGTYNAYANTSLSFNDEVYKSEMSSNQQ